MRTLIIYACMRHVRAMSKKSTLLAVLAAVVLFVCEKHVEENCARRIMMRLFALYWHLDVRVLFRVTLALCLWHILAK